MVSSRCVRCGNLDIWGNHKCPPMWYCIHAEDYGNDVFPPADYMATEGKETYDIDAEHAAVKFAEHYCASSAWYPSSMDIIVMDRNEEKMWKYEITQEAVPSFFVRHDYEPTIVDAVHEGDDLEREL